MRQILIRYRQINTSSNSYYEKTLATGAVRCIDDEIPFEIPQGWEWVRFRTITRQITDGTHNTPKYVEKGIPFISVKDMSSGTICFDSTKFISEDEHKILTTRCFPEKGDLLLSKVGTTGVPALINTDNPFSIFVSIALIKFFYQFIDSDYIVYTILSPLVQEQAKDNTRGVGNKNWVLNAIANTLLPIPPYREQVRIVEKFSLLESQLKKYEDFELRFTNLSKCLADRLKQSILQEAIQGKLVPQKESEGTAEELLEDIRTEKKRLVKEGKLKKSAIANESRIFRGDDNKYYTINNGNMVEVDEIPFDIPNSWSWVRLGEIFDHNTGKALNGKGSGNLLRKYLTTSNLYWDYFDFSKIKEMYFSDSEIEKCTITKGDLLVCEGGDVGRAAIWSYDYDMCIQNHIHRLRAYFPICTRFFYYVLRYYKHIGLIGGKGIGIQGLSSKALHDIIIPLPTLAEQERISSHLDFVLASIMSR